MGLDGLAADIAKSTVVSFLGEKIASSISLFLSSLSQQIWLIPVLIIVIAVETVALGNQNRLKKKLYIDGKSYYDIILDILFFSHHKPRNNITINTLKWDFTCTYYPGSKDFLDITENWKINFSPNRPYTVSDLRLGIRGGNIDDLQENAIEAHHGAIRLRRPRMDLDGKKTESMCIPLDSDIRPGSSEEVTASFKWKKFIVVDRKDDYFYFLPKCLANKVQIFHFCVSHPYDCTPTIVLLRRNLFGSYKMDQITKETAAKFKAAYHDCTPTKLDFEVQGLNAMDVLLIIFDRSNASR